MSQKGYFSVPTEENFPRECEGLKLSTTGAEFFFTSKQSKRVEAKVCPPNVLVGLKAFSEGFTTAGTPRRNLQAR